jgi:hypothetical protein
MSPIAKALSTMNQELSIHLVPSYDDLESSTVEPFTYTADFESVAKDPAVVVHSSGSTGTQTSIILMFNLLTTELGLPKPITITHGSLAATEEVYGDVNGRKRYDFSLWNKKKGRRYYTIFPPFHVSIRPVWHDILFWIL